MKHGAFNMEKKSKKQYCYSIIKINNLIYMVHNSILEALNKFQIEHEVLESDLHYYSAKLKEHKYQA